MKIVYDHQIFDSQPYGGISRYIYELARCLSVGGREDIAIVAPLYVNEYLKYSSNVPKVFGLPIKRFKGAGRICRAINYVIARILIGCIRPNIVHETYYSARRIAPKSAKVILTVYDMIHERFSDQMAISELGLSEQKALAVTRADHIICISHQTKHDLIELFGVDSSKISVVYLGFGLKTNFPKRNLFDRPKRPFLLYVGDRAGYKNFSGLVRAYSESAKLKDNFDLICFGGGKFTGKEVSLFQDLGLNVNTLVQVSGSDLTLAAYYQAATAFIYPSMYEGFGIPPLEAMSFNCPVACSNVSSMPEVVGNAAIMFDPNDTQSIRLALEKIVGDSALRQILIECGQERIKQFSWERCANQTLEVYRKVLL